MTTAPDIAQLAKECVEEFNDTSGRTLTTALIQKYIQRAIAPIQQELKRLTCERRSEKALEAFREHCMTMAYDDANPNHISVDLSLLEPVRQELAELRKFSDYAKEKLGHLKHDAHSALELVDCAASELSELRKDRDELHALVQFIGTTGAERTDVIKRAAKFQTP